MTTHGNSEKRSPPVSFNMALAFYCLLSILLFPVFQYQINPDGTSYITIAQKFASGNITEAISGHWGPLFSFILVPAIWLGINPLTATKILNCFFGFCVFLIIHIYCNRYNLTRAAASSVYFSLVPIIVYFSYYLVTPDLLLSLVLLLYLFTIFFDHYVTSRKWGLLAGAAAGLAFLAKSYALPFFFSHFFLMNIFYFFSFRSERKRKTIIWNYCAGMIVFIMIIAPWVTMVSKKYGTFTVSTQTVHNFQHVQPDPPPASRSFIPPPNETAVSVWEDPYSRIEKISWRPYNSFADFKHWVKFFLKNISPTIKIFFLFSPFVFTMLVVVTLKNIFSPLKFLKDRTLSIPIFTSLLYASGYCLILVDERYIWITSFLMLLMGGVLLSRYYKNKQSTRTRILILSAIFIISFISMPVYRLTQSGRVGRSYDSARQCKKLYELSTRLSKIIEPGHRLAAENFWYESMTVAFFLKCSIYGTTYNMTAEKATQELERHKIDYFIVWSNPTAPMPFLFRYKYAGEATYDNLNVKVYKKN